MALSLSVYARVLAFSGLAVVASAVLARADEAFLCAPDTVVYVKPSELEEKKKTDSCVASYFGIEIDPVAETPEGPKKSAASSARGTKVARPVAFKKLSSPETSERITQRVERTAELGPPSASPGTDYRNVRVINASSPSEQWFKHTR